MPDRKNGDLIMGRINDESLAKGNFLETNKDVYNGQKRHLDFEWEKQKFLVDLKGKSVRSSVQISVQSESDAKFLFLYLLSMMCMDSGSSEQYAHAGSSPVSRTKPRKHGVFGAFLCGELCARGRHYTKKPPFTGGLVVGLGGLEPLTFTMST